MNSLQAALFEANQTFVNGAGTQNPNTSDPTYIIQRANWLQAEADYTNQQNVISQAQAALNSASLALSLVSNTITAPISGTVLSLTLTPGLPIAGSTNVSSETNGSNTSSSQTVGNITLVGGSQQAEVALSEIDVPKVKVGQKVTMTLDAFPGKTFTGKVSTIDTNGSVSSGVTTYPAVITFDIAPKAMYPNMAVSATIITDVKNDVILVPSAAIQTANGESQVRVMRNGQVTAVPVEAGEQNDTQTEIISGIREGDIVVTGVTNQNTSQGSQQNTSPFGGRGFGGGAFRPGGGSGGGRGGGDQH
jgi:macrolide-specific efflux system membrane fusion protein